MEEKLILTDSNGEKCQNMKDIILEFDKSIVSVDPLVFNNFGDDKTDTEIGIEKNISATRFQLEVNESENDEKNDLDFMFDKDLSEIDFEISKDMFDDIKLKEENIIGFVEKVSSQLENGSERNSNFKLPFFIENLDENKVTSLEPEIKNDTEETLNKNSFKENHQIEMIFEESLEIPFCPNTEKIIEGEKSKLYSISNEEVERIMSELQATPLIQKINQDSNQYLGTKDNNCISNINKKIIDKEDLKNAIFSTEENISSSTLVSFAIADNTDKFDLKSHEKNIVLDTQFSENISYNDSIQAAIESVIQASLQDLDSNDSSNQEEINEKQDEKKIPYGIFEVVVPLIGRNVMKPGNDAPFTHRYDLARKRNEMKGKFQKNDPDFSIPNMSFEEWRKKRESRTKEEIAAEERKKVVNAIQLAKSFTKIAIKILLEYEKDEPNQAAMTKFFRFFELAPASPLSLLYAPHFVHTMMLCRGDEDLSPNLRRAANECYDKCHALFPIPEGYNFETVYTSEVKKYVPDELDKLNDHLLDYGDYDSSDLEDDASDSSTESDKDWE